MMTLGGIRLALLFVISLGAMYIAGQFNDRFSSAATSQGLTRMAKHQEFGFRYGERDFAEFDDIKRVEGGFAFTKRLSHYFRLIER